MSSDENKTEQFMIRMTAKLRQQIEVLAKEERRSASAQAVVLIEHGLGDLDRKPREFVAIVHSCILTNAINLASQPQVAKEYRHEISVTGTMHSIASAVRASKRIPSHVTVEKAAEIFLQVNLTNLRDAHEKAGGKTEIPAWMHGV
jgi:hypothetical protein